MISSHVRLFGAVVALLLGASGPAPAQQLELKLMAPAAPGGGWDQTARSMQQALVAAGVARSVQVTNVPGAGGSVGIAQFVNGAKGDGNQMMVNGFVMVGALAMNKSPVTLDQVTPIARLTEEIQVIVVPANSPIKTAQDLAAAVKADIAKVTFAGGSAGGVDHVMAALFAGTVGADAKKINYIPFSGGGESLAAILGGKVTAGISGLSEYDGQIKAGKLRALGVTSANRLPGVDIPTFKEQGIDLVLANWRSVVAPPGITPEQRKVLSDAVEKMVKSDAWKEILKQKGWDREVMTPDSAADNLPREPARRVDRAGVVIAAALAALAAVLVWDASKLPATTMYGMGPEAMPVVIAIGLVILAVGNLFDALRGNLPPRESMDPKPVLLIIGGLALLIAIIGLGGGFILATSALFVTTSAAFGRRTIMADTAIALVITTLVYLAFDKLLTLSLPAGPLERLL